MNAAPARVRATSYITRLMAGSPQLLVFEYAAKPHLGTHVPGGGVEEGERPDDAAIREAAEETGISAGLRLLGTVGVQQGFYDSGGAHVTVYFHLESGEPRDRWTHIMLGDPDAWDTGHPVECRFVSLDEAAILLKAARYGQEEFLLHLHTQGDHGDAPA